MMLCEMNSLISVIVPVYKVEEYLDECVQSLVDQTYSNLEIILVDDGSPDQSPQMCDEWARKDGRVRVVHKSNGGLSSARNAGLDIAQGDYISFIDSDDYVDKLMYEKLYEGVRKYPNVGISSIKFLRLTNGKVEPYNKMWDDQEEVLVKSEDFGVFTLLQKSCHASTNKLYRADLLKNVRFRVGKTNEDTLFMFDLSKEVQNKKVDMLELPYYAYYYRMHEGSICNNCTVPVEVAIIENLSQIIRESSDDRIKSAAVYMKNRTSFFLCTLLAQWRNKTLYDRYFDHYRSNLKNVRYSDVRNPKFDSANLKYAFWMIKYSPFLYNLFCRLKGANG